MQLSMAKAAGPYAMRYDTLEEFSVGCDQLHLAAHVGRKKI